LAQAESLGVCVQVPSLPHVSVVHAIKSSQPASPQHVRQPTPGQQVPPLTQFSYLQLPLTHEPLAHGSPLLQSASFTHWAVCTQPLAVSHANPDLHVVPSSVWLQLPEAHVSFVQSTMSSQPAAEQQLPHVADVLSAFGQHVGPAADPAQSASLWHWPAWHVSVVHGSESLHCESSQHLAQPEPGQHSMPVPQSVVVCSQSAFVQASSVHGFESSQPVLSVQDSFLRQPLAMVQYSSAAQLSLFGECVQAPAKQSSSVQPTLSLQLLLSQHSPQVPLQQTWVASHLGARLQKPSAPHWSIVHGSPSSQSSGPWQACVPAPAAPSLVPPVLEPPEIPPSAAPEPPAPPASNCEPPQA
jgi:hypothetical protein